MNVETTPDNSGASKEACQIVNRLMEFDGFSKLRIEEQEQPTGFFAHLARTVSQELEGMEATRSKCGHVWGKYHAAPYAQHCRKCGAIRVVDRADGRSP